MPIMILRCVSRLLPGRMLDVGARDCSMASNFSRLGYDVDAIDPAPPPAGGIPQGISYRQTTLEKFDSATRYDLVIASMVSHLITYEIPDLLERLKSLTANEGLLYLTLLGDEDDWATNPRSKAMQFDEALKMIAESGLKPLFRSVEGFNGSTYAGDEKFWHIYRFLLSRE